MATTPALNQSSILQKRASYKNGLKLDIQTDGKASLTIRSDRVKGVLLTMLGAFCFALAPVWVRSINAFSPVSIVFYRALIGAVPLFFWVVRSSELRSRADLRQLGWKHGLVLLGIGLSMSSTACFYYFAVMKTTVAKAVLLHYTAPIYVALISPLLLKEKNTLLSWCAIGIGIVGIALVTEPSAFFKAGKDEMLGIISALFSGLCLAGVFLFGRFLSGNVPSLIRTMWGCLIVVIVLLPWGVSVPEGHFRANLPFLFILGTVSLVLPYTFFFKAQNYISAKTASIAALFEPVCGVALGFLIYGEGLSLLGGIGAAAVMASIYISAYR